MLIPLGTERPLRIRPIVTQAIIILNLLVYLTGVAMSYFGAIDVEAFINAGHFQMAAFRIWQLVTYQFLHDPYGIGHLAFNMLFLWVFGRSVEERFGHLNFAIFYVMAGMVAGLAHGVVMPSAPVIGASGSIAGVTGAFLALFPRSRIRILIFFLFIGIVSIPASWIITFKIALDLLNQIFAIFGTSESSTAYAAHLAGYAFGFLLSFALLAFGVLKREEMDIFFLLRQQYRRAQLRAINKKTGGAIWDTRAVAVKDPTHTPAKPMSEKQISLAKRRSEINELVDTHRLDEAAAIFRTLLREHPDTLLSEGRQLDLANQLYAEKDYESASIAYESLLAHYPLGAKADEVRLILTLIYSRHIVRRDRAREILDTLQRELRVEGLQALADQLREELEATKSP
jgi:membrane associated rhomboid family serine protease